MLFLFVLLWTLLWALLNDRKCELVFGSAFWKQAVSLLSWGYSREIRLNGASLLILRRSQTTCSLMSVCSLCDTDQTVVISPNIQALFSTTLSRNSYSQEFIYLSTKDSCCFLFPLHLKILGNILNGDWWCIGEWGVVTLCDCCSPSNLCSGSFILHTFVFGSTSLSSIHNHWRLKSCWSPWTLASVYFL